MVDAVLSFHLNPHTCGVAKFNHALAQRLGVPCLDMQSKAAWLMKSPLLSVKWAELPPTQRIGVPWTVYDILSHDWPQTARDAAILSNARHTWFAEDLGCPSTIEGNPTRGTYRVLTFGMAHKLLLPHFEQLKAQLDAEHPDYTIELSTAVHEGNPWDGAMEHSVTAMRGIFGDKLRVLGYLGDDALAKELRDVDAVACYYTPALRANNTTYWAAVDAGKTIYTNRDEQSPATDAPPASWDRILETLRG